MKTNGFKITQAIASLIMIVGAILGIVYILTGETFEGKFVGHLTNRLNSAIDSKDSMPEVLAFAAMGVFFVGMIVSLIGIHISQKGMARSEKRIESKEFNLFMIGILIGVIAVVVLAVLTPKMDTDYTPKSMTWFWIIVVVLIATIVIIITGYIQWYKKSKSPLISHGSVESSTTDEF